MSCVNHKPHDASGRYIWQSPDWPNWCFDAHALTLGLSVAAHELGRLKGRLQSLGFNAREHAQLSLLTQEVLNTSEIEGEYLQPQSVRSSIARRLGVNIGALLPTDRHIEGVVEMVLDATSLAHLPLTESRLMGWHAALFPTGYSGLSQIRVAQWRDDALGPMQVVSGKLGARIDRQTVHFEAPPAKMLPDQMRRFMTWFEQTSADQSIHPLIKAGLAHLWFVTLHPFDDGNGRIARAISDLVLSRADGVNEMGVGQRFYSVSAQIQRERKTYYDMLEGTQNGRLALAAGAEPLDVTPWLAWFLGCLTRAILASEQTIEQVIGKARFWERMAHERFAKEDGTTDAQGFNPRQIKILNKLLDGFDGTTTQPKITTSKWAQLAKCSSDSALRDIAQLVAAGALRKTEGGGRSTRYEITTG